MSASAPSGYLVPPVSSLEGLELGSSVSLTSSTNPGVDEIIWKLARSCSLTPDQLAVVYGGLCLLSLSVALFFWVQGAWLVAPFACFELLAVGLAFWVCARHACDVAWVSLLNGKWVIQRCYGRRLSVYEFAASWAVVEITSDDRQWVRCRSGVQAVYIGTWLRLEQRGVLVRELKCALTSSLTSQRQVSHHAPRGRV